MTIGQFGNGIRNYFGVNPNEFLWKEGLIAFGKIMIDIIQFEEWLSQKEGYNENESIKDNITRMYGVEASHFVESVL